MTSSRRAVRALSIVLSAGLASGAAADVVKFSPDNLWGILDRMPNDVVGAPAWIRPDQYAAVQLDLAGLIRALQGAPMENTPGAAQGLVISLPTPEGGFARFRIVEAPIMEAPLAAQFPQIKTYRGQGIDDPGATIRFDYTPLGFHAQVLSPSGAVYIDPFSRNDTTHYAVYYKRDYSRKPGGWTCGVTDDLRPVPPGRRGGSGSGATDTPNGSTLRTYRLACAADGEYVAFFGGTVTLGMSAITTAINRVDGVYEVELSIHMVLVANNSSIVYTNSSTDPYTNSNGGTMLGQNQTTCDSAIGTANYDIGHVFSTGGGGVAGLGVVGVSGNKARGVTGLGSPVGDPFYIDYVAHEMGHQFGANHCFNSSTSSCGGGNRSGSHAYEPGSSSTIMGYAGICGADDLQPHSDPYFLFDSLDAIIAYTSGGAGAGNTQTATGNAIPTVNAGVDYTIPTGTPFALTAVGSDSNPGDVLTYCWEERDLGASITLAAGDNGSSPIIRSWTPTASPTRTIPRLSNLLSNTFAVGEILPTVTRTNMNFRCTIRDNRAAGGAVNNDDMIVHVVNTGAAFAVTAPNTAVSWPGGSSQTVTWNVAGTTASGINCANVAILLSTDGGNTYPTTILASTANNGSANITVPSTPSTTARIKVAAVGNIFFDISNVNFTITGITGPANDTCANAATLSDGSTAFTTVNATTDGPSEPSCSLGADNQVNQDVWYTYAATCSGLATIGLCDANFDTRIAVYNGSACPSSPGTAIACNDNACGAGGLASQVSFSTIFGNVYKIRVGGAPGATGTGTITVGCESCWANCDGGNVPPILNVADFTCFLQRYANNDPYANCDGSTVPPVLNVQDFTCFLQRYANGCP